MADINKTINDLEKFRKELFEMHDWWEENTVSSAIALLKEQKETIQSQEERIENLNEMLQMEYDKYWE